MSSNAEILSLAKAGNRFLLIKDSTITLFFPCAITLYNPGLPEMAMIPFKSIKKFFGVKNKQFVLKENTFPQITSLFY